MMTDTARPMIVYDKHCMLCSTSMAFVLRHDRDRIFRLVAAQSQMGQTAYRDLGLNPDDLATMIVIANGQAYTESSAALHVLGALGWPWRVAVLAHVIPSAIRDRVYRLIARNRYRWFGRRRSCPLPAKVGDEAP